MPQRPAVLACRPSVRSLSGTPREASLNSINFCLAGVTFDTATRMFRPLLPARRMPRACNHGDKKKFSSFPASSRMLVIKRTG